MATTTRGIRTVVTLLAALLIGAPSSAVADTSSGTGPSGAEEAERTTARLSVDEMERKVRVLTNKKRVAHGCGRLKPNGGLTKAAGRHSGRMAAAFELSHQLEGEPPLKKRIVRAGYQQPTAWGENVAVGYATPRAVVDAWMASPGHRANILNCQYRHLGVGLEYGDGAPWWTQDFGRK